MQFRKTGFFDHIKVLGLYIVLLGLMTMPVILHMQSRVAGIGGDPWQTMWRFTVKEQQGFRGFLADVLGKGDPQLVNLSIWPWMPIHAVLGEPAGYNTIFLLNFLLSGYAMALLVSMLVKKPIFSPAPVMAGIAYMFAPYHIAHSLGHFGAMQLEWIPFILATTLSYIRKQNIWKVILLSVLVVIQAWEEHHYALWLAVFALITGVVYWPAIRQLFGGQARIKFLLSSIVFIAIMVLGVIVPNIPTVKLANTDSSALTLGIDQTTRFSADLFAFITPAPFQPVWGSVFDNLFGQYFTGNTAESVQYIGVGILIAILFFKKHIPVLQKRLWFGALIVFGIISLGPVLHIFGHVTSIPLPYALLAKLPVFSAIRTISRAGVFVTIASCVLFGWVVATNYHRLRTTYIIAGFLLLDFLFIPFPMQSAVLSPAYSMLASVPGSSIIEIPAATNYVAASRSLYGETIDHKQAIGNIALERGQSQDTFNLAKSVPAIRQLLYLRTTELEQDRPELFTQDLRETLPDAMTWLDTSAILLHTDSISSTQKNAVEKFLDDQNIFSKTSFGDADVYIRNTNMQTKADGVFLIRGDGFENVGYDPKRLATFAEIPNAATAILVNVSKKPVHVELSYTVPDESQDSLILQDEHGNMLDKKNIIVQPGQLSVVFKNTGNTKAIIANPVMTVTAL
ncbi:MAG: hypothetical protein K8Q97_00140 [Candidatus Andersenbacteria bacterium]|nr:hypothetical protein [Candidatus Andersenbacteria bacterium]